jgi:hypothetical protein
VCLVSTKCDTKPPPTSHRFLSLCCTLHVRACKYDSTSFLYMCHTHHLETFTALFFHISFGLGPINHCSFPRFIYIVNDDQDVDCKRYFRPRKSLLLENV